eukprot:CAMPEP_0184864868 /NCGR_PEP_ID=MMETSP0580-20130426/16164_1 /TAXON_ID=1118495 /ORGANISM="Dactyliosolen fragilissimus" /LENGTH=478 /DNA_ID=CAMNT_0027363797 /DNA_START=308 /DNA_END=1744 /DNA_ORIENTATION=+
MKLDTYHDGDAGSTTCNKGSSIHPSFSSYLSSVTSEVSNNHIDGIKLNAIIGNEAGDADSIISSLALSYVLSDGYCLSSSIGNKAGCHSGNSIPSSSLCVGTCDHMNIPVVSVERNDMALRRDTSLLLEMANIDWKSLLYYKDAIINDIFSSRYSSEFSRQNLSLTLVDHNRIRSELCHIEDAVTKIIDHHEDESCHVQVPQSDRIIAFENKRPLVGSTCTLVTELLMENMKHDHPQRFKALDPQLGLSLLGVILLDTMNMDKSAGKGIPRDAKAIQFLLDSSQWMRLEPGRKYDELDKIFPNGIGSQPDCSSLYAFLSQSKFDTVFWDEMSTRDTLRIDYKNFQVDQSTKSRVTCFGISSVLLQLDSLVSKEEFHKQLETYMNEEADVPLLVVMAMILRDGKPQRELMLVANDDNLLENLTKFLLFNNSAAFLQLSEVVNRSNTNNINMVRMNQANSKGSRKQVAPILLEFFSRNKS